MNAHSLSSRSVEMSEANVKTEAVALGEADARQRAIRKGRPRRTKRQRREILAAYLFLSPALLLFVVFIAGPFLGAFGLSLFSWDMFTPAQFVGLANYGQLLT